MTSVTQLSDGTTKSVWGSTCILRSQVWPVKTSYINSAWFNNDFLNMAASCPDNFSDIFSLHYPKQRQFATIFNGYSRDSLMYCVIIFYRDLGTIKRASKGWVIIVSFISRSGKVTYYNWSNDKRGNKLLKFTVLQQGNFLSLIKICLLELTS